MPLSPARGVGRALADRLFVRGTVTDVDQITRRMRRITVTAPGLSWTPGQQIRVAADGLLTRRTYSVWDYDGSSLELCVLDHGDGPGARWARTVRPGDDVVFSGPEGTFVTRPSPYHLFAGEETASVAFGPMIRALGDAPVYGVIEADTPDDRLPVNLTWHYREGAPAASSATLLTAVRDLDLPDEPGTAYVAGEARTVQAVRDHLVRERGWPRRSVLTKPFWTPGKKGLE
ncbi:siderophore-interacting protein [Actinoallomurus sp. CA-150999]|uniref:siderophore-interacting protein n=1 Tax=Actinoallomurus sp. CA-150999 TaxID=3239887 RepID=UPI003D8F492A